ncbi:unnamed protein product [Allacma fusca]|uniref:Uncharacterized protein n=1 Tax=Allacma fusca TaxID=39272 RepID=A0A8J2PHY6_9HEXA|nr:unnamed protein product [Allacma fusca]
MSGPSDLETPPENETDTAIKNLFGFIGINGNESSSWSPTRSLSIPINIQTKDGPVTYIITTAPDENPKPDEDPPKNTIGADSTEVTQLQLTSESEGPGNEEPLSTISSVDCQSSGLRVSVNSLKNKEAPTVQWDNLVTFEENPNLEEICSNDLPKHPAGSDTTAERASNSIPAESNPSADEPNGTILSRKKPNKLKGKKLRQPEKTFEPNPIPRRKIVKKNRKPKSCSSIAPSKLESSIEENSEGSEGIESVLVQKSKHKKKRKIADWLAEGIDPTKLEENVDQVRMRFEKGCECPGENCFEGLSHEFVYKHRLNIAELTRPEHDMYLMGVTMATLSNPEATAKHTKRQRLRTSYVFLGREVCLDAWLYLENCTHYQLKRIRKHLVTHGVSPRVHGNQGKKPHNTFPFRSYQLAFDFLNNWFSEFVIKLNKSNASQGIETPKPRHSKHTPAPVYLPQEQTRKKLHQEYKTFFQNQSLAHNQQDRSEEEEDPDKYKVMGYSSFSQFLKVRFPHVKFAKVELNNAKGHQQTKLKDTEIPCNVVMASNDGSGEKLILDSTCTIQSIDPVSISSTNVAGEDHFVISIPINPKTDNIGGTCAANIIYVDTSEDKSDFKSSSP